MAVPARFGDEFRLNTTTAFDEQDGSITGLANGQFVGVWSQGTASHQIIVGQIFNADGSVSGSEFTIASGNDDEEQPVVGARPDGSFVVAWTENDPAATTGDGSGSSVNARVFDVDGTPQHSAFRVNLTATTNNQFGPAIAVGHDGSFVISWQSDTTPMVDDDISAQYFGPNGVKVGANFPVHQTLDFQFESAVTSLKNGNYVIAWGDGGNSDGSQSYIGGEIFSKDGQIVKAPFVINSPTTGPQSEPSLAGLSDGTFVAVWEDDNGGGGGDIRMRRFTADGTAIGGSDTAVKADPAYFEGNPNVTALTNGYAVTWFDDDTTTPTTDTSMGYIGVKLFNNDGTAASDAFIANTKVTEGAQTNAKVTELADGRILVTWTDPGEDATQPDHGTASVRGQIFDPRKAAVDLPGTKLDDDLIGTAFGDHIAGAKGSDTLEGQGGADKLEGGKGADFLFGDDGADRLTGGKGADRMHAGDDHKKDVFVFASKHDSGDTKDTADRLYDFVADGKHVHGSDKIDLSGIDADSHQKHDQEFRFVDHFSKASGNDPDGEVMVQDAGKNVKVLVDVNGDKDADMVILVMHVNHLHQADFIL